MSRSNNKLEENIKNLRQKIGRMQVQLSFLLELRENRLKSGKIHSINTGGIHSLDRVTAATGVDITAVLCVCGHETIYKIPLTDIKDFVCPKDPNREGRKEN